MPWFVRAKSWGRQFVWAKKHTKDTSLLECVRGLTLKKIVRNIKNLRCNKQSMQIIFIRDLL